MRSAHSVNGIPGSTEWGKYAPIAEKVDGLKAGESLKIVADDELEARRIKQAMRARGYMVAVRDKLNLYIKRHSG